MAQASKHSSHCTAHLFTIRMCAHTHTHTVTVRQSVSVGRRWGGKRNSNGETDRLQAMCMCSCLVYTIVNGCVDCRPLEERAPSEYTPWQLATLGRFAQLSSSSCAVVEQMSCGTSHSTCSHVYTFTHMYTGRGRVSLYHEFDLQVIVVTLVCNFVRIMGKQHCLTHSVFSPSLFVSLSPSPLHSLCLSPPLIVIDSAACVRLCSHAVGGHWGTHIQHRATFWWAMINELCGGWHPLAETEPTFSHLPLSIQMHCSSSGITATTQAQILLALPHSQSHSPTHSKTQSQNLT